MRCLEMNDETPELVKLVQAYRDVFNSSAGAIVLADLAFECEFHTVSRPIIGNDAMLNYTTGKRDIYLLITHRLDTDPKALEEAIKQAERKEPEV